MLWKKTKVLCKTWYINMLRNSRWDKMKLCLYLRWQLHIKLIITSPHSDNSILFFFLKLKMENFWLEQLVHNAPWDWLHGVLSSANCCQLSQEFETHSNQQNTCSRWTQMKQAQETPGVTNAEMRFCSINSWNGPTLLWNSGWNVWFGKARWNWFFLNTLFPSGLWITVVWGSWARTK